MYLIFKNRHIYGFFVGSITKLLLKVSFGLALLSERLLITKTQHYAQQSSSL
jgi:hypothetical protein